LDRHRHSVLLELHARRDATDAAAVFPETSAPSNVESCYIMYAIHILWLVVAVEILQPNKPSGSTKEPRVIGDFWHAATYIEALDIMWIYLITYLLIFLSREAADVRNVISEGSDGDFEIVRKWVAHHRRRRRSTASARRPVLKRYNIYATVQRYITRLAVRFGELYVATGSNSSQRLLWIVAELLFPWYI